MDETIYTTFNVLINAQQRTLKTFRLLTKYKRPAWDVILAPIFDILAIANKGTCAALADVLFTWIACKTDTNAQFVQMNNEHRTLFTGDNDCVWQSYANRF